MGRIHEREDGELELRCATCDAVIGYVIVASQPLKVECASCAGENED